MRGVPERSGMRGFTGQSGLWSGLRGLTGPSGLWSGLRGLTGGRTGSGADSVMASRTTGLDFIGEKSAARTYLMGESSNLCTSLGIPGALQL